MTKPVRIDESWRRRLAGEFEEPECSARREGGRTEDAAQRGEPPATQSGRAGDDGPGELHEFVWELFARESTIDSSEKEKADA